MIPRLRPAYGGEELLAALRPSSGADVERFERAFATKFEAARAVAFPYGRTALKAFLEAVGLKNAEVITPSYTCVVVQHAIVLSGNVPVFVDSDAADYNMNLDQVEAAITSNTGAIVATHLFGFPLDVERLRSIVEAAERRHGRKIWVIQDCAHAFGARWNGRLAAPQGDAALFGLNISKIVAAVFGGMLTFNDPALADRLRQWRVENLSRGSVTKSVKRFAYLAATYPAFMTLPYGVVHFLQYRTPVLDRLTRAYHLDEEIRFPPDAGELMLPIEARVGLVQLGKYDWMIERRRALAARYTDGLSGVPGWVLPPLPEGATFSHYPVRVPERQAAVTHFARHGVHLGDVADYSVAHLPAYRRFAHGKEFPNSLDFSRHLINVPIHPQLSDRQADRIVKIARLIR